LLAALTESLAKPAKITEIGLLDGLSGSEIEELQAKPDEPAVTARLAGGVWLSLSRRKIGNRANAKVAAVGGGDFDLVVLMSTGIFRDLESTCPTVNAQRALDSAVISVAAQSDTVGMIYPLAQQALDPDIPSISLFKTVSRHAAHSNTEQLKKAARALKDCSYVVLNSVGYTEDDRRAVSETTGRPVILPRRIVTNSIRLILSSLVSAPVAELSGELRAKLEDLTNRERQVLSLVCEGLTNKEIARQLSISHKTVEIHRSNVLRKMGAPSSGALIRQMVQAGFA